MWLDRDVELEDVLAATREQLATSREQNAQQQQLIAFLQQSLEAFQLTQHGLVEQIRTQTEIMEQQQRSAEQDRVASQARIAELEAIDSDGNRVSESAQVTSLAL